MLRLRKTLAVALLAVSITTVASAAPQRRDDDPLNPVRSAISKVIRQIRRAFLPWSQDGDIVQPKP